VPIVYRGVVNNWTRKVTEFYDVETLIESDLRGFARLAWSWGGGIVVLTPLPAHSELQAQRTPASDGGVFASFLIYDPSLSSSTQMVFPSYRWNPISEQREVES
jgi:hypothetical protein